MKIVRFIIIIALLALYGAAMQGAPAIAESQSVASAELRGIEKVFGLISNVSLSQTDLKSNQFILDILDTKSEVDTLKDAQSGLKAPAVSSGSRSALQGKTAPPTRRYNKLF